MGTTSCGKRCSAFQRRMNKWWHIGAEDTFSGTSRLAFSHHSFLFLFDANPNRVLTEIRQLPRIIGSKSVFPRS
jgi:hypothetical protein